MKQLREQRQWSLRRLGERVHCSHGYLWELETGGKRPSISVAALIDAALGADGALSAMVRQVSADTTVLSADIRTPADAVALGLEFAPDWRHGIEVAADLWQGDMQRRDLLRTAGFSATAYLAPAMRWLLSPLDDQPTHDGVRLVGAPDVETVRRITGVYRTLDNQFGGGHVREGLVRFLDGEVAALGSGAEAVDLARAAGRAATDAGVAAIQAEAAVLEAQG
ncbi:MAG: helix-turn-helix transcriptional regulator, partial [Dactylosporangium sp.]|nr:helix-turn-helix domain-containing protein [Dactylosporangium sp.]NNJ59914.1 helix-turn-helix transcriptional regulator [Dactylosporangium sp.]